jgi:hypothetical protein
MKPIFALILSAALAAAQTTTIPDGTKLRVRLDQTISSSTAEQGQTVELSVTDPVKIGDQIAIPEGARVTGTITEAQEKRHMGRAGKLDFSIDRVRAADGQWIPLRYSLNKKSGESHATRTGIITAGAAVVFWPAAPVFLLMKGKDVNINKGVIFDTFTDQDHALGETAFASPASGVAPAMSAAPKSAAGNASVTITSNHPGAEIEVDGAYVGSTPTTLVLPAGPHQISVRGTNSCWQRNLQVSPGSTITVNAVPEDTRVASRGAR